MGEMIDFPGKKSDRFLGGLIDQFDLEDIAKNTIDSQIAR